MNTDASTAARPPLRRAADDRLLLGVCSGIAATLGVRPLFVRVATVVLSAIAFPLLVVAYAAVALIVPRDDGRALLGGEPRDGREQLLGWSAVGFAGLLLLVAGFDPEQLVWPALSGAGLLLAAGGVIALAVREGRRTAAPAVPGARAPGTPPAPTPPPREPAPPAPATTVVLASDRPATAIQDDTIAMDQPAPPAAAAPRRRRRGRTWLIATGVTLLVLAAIVAAGAVALGAIGGIGDTTKRPATVADLDSEYRLGVGAMDIDLRELQLPRGTTDVRARVGAGEVTVFVPRGVRVESVGPTELTGVDRVNRAARALELRERRELRAARARATAGGGRTAARGGRTARRPRAAAPPAPEPRTVRIDADVSLGSASVIASGG